MRGFGGARGFALLHVASLGAMIFYSLLPVRLGRSM